MHIIWKSTKRLSLAWLIATFVYMTALFFSINYSSKNSLVLYPIQPFIFGSEPVDLFFPLFTTIPFVWPIYFLRKDNFLEYVSMRIKLNKYLVFQTLASLALCFVMVLLVNYSGFLFSLRMANISSGVQGPTLTGYILGEMQLLDPLKFGLLWSFYKAVIGLLICSLGIIFAYYVKNLFLMFLAPFALIFLENFITGVTGLARFSFTTTYVLNRLSPSAMVPKNLLVGISTFIVLTIITQRVLVHHEQQNY
ncbi:MAG: hypothetical protein ABFD05_07185 [Anaerolineaceae bacterium]